jgi:signal transduction histidine kinase
VRWETILTYLPVEIPKIRSREEATEMAIFLARKGADAIALAVAALIGLVISGLWYQDLVPPSVLLGAHIAFWAAGLALLRWLTPSGEPIRAKRAVSGSALSLTVGMAGVLLVAAALSRGIPTPSMVISEIMDVPSLFIYLALAAPAVVVGRRLAEPPEPPPLIDDAGAMRRHQEALSIVFHELRRPLATLVTASELALDDETPEDHKANLLRTVHRQALRLGDFMEELLETSRIQSGTLRLNPRATDLQPLVEELCEEFQATHREHEMRVKLVKSPLLANVDPAKLRMVLGNLLANAAAYSPPGSTITVRLFGEMDSVVCQVEDEGPGVPEPYRKEIFQQFFRVPGARQGGFGLGLYIARQIVLAHKGTLGVDSGMVRGATFTLTLPALTRSEAEAESPPVSSSRESEACGPSAERPRREGPARKARPSREDTAERRADTARR